MSLNNKGKLVVTLFFLLLLAVGAVYIFVFQKANIDQVVQSANITNFQQCMDAGFPVMESFPRQCMDGEGNHYTESINTVSDKQDKIVVDIPASQEVIASPVSISGKARGSWFFEASFPIEVLDSSGKIIGSGAAHADGDWMTQDFVPFKAKIDFTVDPKTLPKDGYIKLKKDNPSGEPANDDYLLVPIAFE